MGCASSRPASNNSHRTRGGHESPFNYTGPDMLSFDIKSMPRPPPPVARGRSQSPYKPSASHKHYPAPSYSRCDRHGKSHPCDTHARGISPPRHRNEMPRRHASHRYRDVSPLGSSRFEQPFERAYLGNGKMGTTTGCSFRSGGIGGWENW